MHAHTQRVRTCAGMPSISCPRAPGSVDQPSRERRTTRAVGPDPGLDPSLDPSLDLSMDPSLDLILHLRLCPILHLSLDLSLDPSSVTRTMRTACDASTTSVGARLRANATAHEQSVP